MQGTDLEKANPMLLNDLILTGKLWRYLVDLNEEVQKQLEYIIQQFKTVECIFEKVKSYDQLTWVKAMNTICNRVEEIV